ncbi:MAG: pitrilysin family protein [Kiritimatiellae bacterium]|nr:pitrilysin family protein [Kiritimatiellia bacterium]
MHLTHSETTLSSGIRVVTSHIPYVESAAVGFWVGVGGRYESKRMSGVSHFIEHLLFKGTQTRSARAISEAIEGRGGYFNAFTQEDATCYYARISAEHVFHVMDILADMYVNPKFDAGDIDKERRVILEEIMMYRDQPHQLAQEDLSDLLWANHPLGRTLIGTPATVMRMTREEILGYKSKKYRPCNTVVAVAGKVDHEACCAYLEKVLDVPRGSAAPKYLRVERSTGQRDVSVRRKPIEQAHLALGLRLFGRKDPRRYPLKLLSVILGENMSSRLFQVVRERHGMAYSVHSGVHLYEDTGALLITAGLDRTRCVPAMKLILRELNRLAEKKVTARELKMAKDYAGGQLRIGLEGTSNQMIWVGEHLLTFGNVRQPQAIIDRLDAVTADDIAKLAGQVLKTKRLSAALLLPEENRETTEQVRELIHG